MNDYSMADINAAFREADNIAMSEFRAQRDAYVAGELTAKEARSVREQYGDDALEYGCLISGRVLS